MNRTVHYVRRVMQRPLTTKGEATRAHIIEGGAQEIREHGGRFAR
jgi:hypothetical protein